MKAVTIRYPIEFNSRNYSTYCINVFTDDMLKNLIVFTCKSMISKGKKKDFRFIHYQIDISFLKSTFMLDLYKISLAYET